MACRWEGHGCVCVWWWWGGGRWLVGAGVGGPGAGQGGVVHLPEASRLHVVRRWVGGCVWVGRKG